MTHTAYICLGSNTPDCRQRIDRALQAIAHVGRITAVSESGMSDDITGRGAPYLNVVAGCSVTVEMPQMRDALDSIERSLGRTAASKPSGVMPLDIDIVVWDGHVVSPADYDRPYFSTGYKLIRPCK